MPLPTSISKYLTMPVPRYTSYPTVPHFNESVGSDVYQGWLKTLANNKPISLYFHVPFCHQLCWYCGCNMKLAGRYEPLKAYTQTVRKELALLRKALPARMAVSHIHWGGGTPTALHPEDLASIMADVKQAFDLQAEAELAIEADPRTLTTEMVDQLAALGFNRISFGVQEFDPEVQKAINRIQPAEMVARWVTYCREQGINAINFDLIYGLPHQTVETLEKTIAEVTIMNPDRVALFGYAHVPWMAKKQRMIDEAALPGASARWQQAESAARHLIMAGYNPIGLDHFAKPGDPLAMAALKGKLKRNFQGYTTDRAETLLGLGASAISRTPNGFAQNLTETRSWTRAIEAGHLPIAKGHANTKEDKARSNVIERLMCYGRVDLERVRKFHDLEESWGQEELTDLESLSADGLVSLNGAVVQVTPKGAPLVRLVAAAFDQYFTLNPARHSKAV